MIDGRVYMGCARVMMCGRIYFVVGRVPRFLCVLCVVRGSYALFGNLFGAELPRKVIVRIS